LCAGNRVGLGELGLNRLTVARRGFRKVTAKSEPLLAAMATTMYSSIS
jgi:hypothetical protein